MKTKLFLTLTLSALTLSACQIRLEGEADLTQNSPASFNGNWISSCDTISSSNLILRTQNLGGIDRLITQSTGSTNSSKQSISVLGDVMTYKIESFDSYDCRSPQFTLRAYIAYELQAQDSFSNNYDIDLHYDVVTMTPESVEVAEFFNMAAFCGSETWQVGVAKDITGRTCAGERINRYGDRYYSTIELGYNHIYFDLNNKSSYEMDRPLSSGSKRFERN